MLGVFDAQHASLTLSEIARRSGLPLATCHRLVAELVTWGALQRGASQR
ncbi:helix-turn-helix domain-containing protein [Micrococcales bacterium 31B]|nr:helix-turn-helix domain-containing protein [Micrococcales bacterium 31B]